MPGYNFYVSDKRNPELVDAFNKMKADGILSEFIVESCEVSMPLFLDRKIAENQAQMNTYLAMKEYYSTVKDKIKNERQEVMKAYLNTVPKDREPRALMGWLTSPASIRDWQEAGFKTAQEVIDALDEGRPVKK